MSPVERILDALERRGCGPRRTGSGWAALCPAHDDGSPSLSIAEGDDGRALVYCHAGCPTAAVLSALGLPFADLMPKEGRAR